MPRRPGAHLAAPPPHTPTHGRYACSNPLDCGPPLAHKDHTMNTPTALFVGLVVGILVGLVIALLIQLSINTNVEILYPLNTVWARAQCYTTSSWRSQSPCCCTREWYGSWLPSKNGD